MRRMGNHPIEHHPWQAYIVRQPGAYVQSGAADAIFIQAQQRRQEPPPHKQEVRLR